jgi:hypothetical protein
MKLIIEIVVIVFLLYVFMYPQETAHEIHKFFYTLINGYGTNQ